jgi:hypothetical protein
MKRGRSIALSQEEPMMRQPFSTCHGYQKHGDHGGYFPQHPPPVQANHYSHLVDQPVSGMYTNMQSNDHLNLNCGVAPHYFPLLHVPSVTPNGEYSSLHAQTNIFNSSSDSAAEQNSSLSGEIQKYHDKMIQDGWKKVGKNSDIFDKKLVSKWKNGYNKLEAMKQRVKKKKFSPKTSIIRRMLAAAES